jgi:hypothetical protein
VPSRLQMSGATFGEKLKRAGYAWPIEAAAILKQIGGCSLQSGVAVRAGLRRPSSGDQGRCWPRHSSLQRDAWHPCRCRQLEPQAGKSHSCASESARASHRGKRSPRLRLLQGQPGRGPAGVKRVFARPGQQMHRSMLARPACVSPQAGCSADTHHSFSQESKRSNRKNGRSTYPRGQSAPSAERTTCDPRYPRRAQRDPLLRREPSSQWTHLRNRVPRASRAG